MAIKSNIELQNGIKVDGAYLRVEFPSINKDLMSFNLRKYVNTDLSFFSEDMITCDYDIEGSNPYSQAYEYLKTLDEYSDAVDC